MHYFSSAGFNIASQHSFKCLGCITLVSDDILLLFRRYGSFRREPCFRHKLQRGDGLRALREVDQYAVRDREGWNGGFAFACDVFVSSVAVSLCICVVYDVVRDVSKAVTMCCLSAMSGPSEVCCSRSMIQMSPGCSREGGRGCVSRSVRCVRGVTFNGPHLP